MTYEKRRKALTLVMGSVKELRKGAKGNDN